MFCAILVPVAERPRTRQGRGREGVSMTRIFVVRHGQTEWNRDERFRGRADIPLNRLGLAQAERVAERLASERGVVAVYSSPLQRALATAAPIARRFNLSVEVDEGLHDLDFGEWQGLLPAEVTDRWPELARRYQLAPQTVRFPGGETLNALWGRALSTLERVGQRHAGGAVVLVSHKVVCKALALSCLGLDPAHYWQVEVDNASISVIDYEDGLFVLRRLNDTAHLEGT